MESIQIKRQYRFVDPVKEIAEANNAIGADGKFKFNWDETEITDATTDDVVDDGKYLSDCIATGARKVVGYRSYESPTTVEEADGLFGGLADDKRLALVKYAVDNRQKDQLSSELMEEYESPEKAQKRLEKKQAKAATTLQEWMMEEVQAGRYPSQDAFNAKVREVHGNLDLPLPEPTEE